MTEREYQELMAQKTGLVETRKRFDPPKGYEGFRGSRSVFPPGGETRTMVMFIEPKADPQLLRKALLVVGNNPVDAEAQQQYVLVETSPGNPAVMKLLHGPTVVVDDIVPPPPAPPPLASADLAAIRALLASYGFQITQGGK